MSLSLSSYLSWISSYSDLLRAFSFYLPKWIILKELLGFIYLFSEINDFGSFESIQDNLLVSSENLLSNLAFLLLSLFENFILFSECNKIKKKWNNEYELIISQI